MIRAESFGGIVQIENPPTLAYIDKNSMLELNQPHSPLWETKQEYLSAPTEIHFSITNQCPMKCKNCYINAGKKMKDELSTKEMMKVIDLLAKLKIFHIAFGGGEAFVRKDFLKIAEYARKKGIIPNVTTNGFYINEEIAKKCKVFGQINVSMDGFREDYLRSRGFDGFPIAEKALKLLRKYNKNVGLNYVITKHNYDVMENFIIYAKKNKCNSVLFLRYKPTGRGALNYDDNKLTLKQSKEIFPKMKKLYKKHKLNFYLDCSFVPMMCYHKPDIKRLNFFCMEGCMAGNVLAGILPNGKLNACSFCNDVSGSIFDFNKLWHKSNHFKKFRDWKKNCKEPCKSCKYLNLCKGGCHVISEHVYKNFNMPDPFCMEVIKNKRKVYKF